jgi:protein involved in polysaccharide export with SLBB domain
VGSVALADEIVREIERLEQLAGSADVSAVTEQQLRVRDLIQRAGGAAAATILQASAERWSRHMGERARLTSYQGQIDAYRAAPAIYRASLYLDALRDIMKNARVYIADPVATMHIRAELQDKELGESLGPNTEPRSEP